MPISTGELEMANTETVSMTFLDLFVLPGKQCLELFFGAYLDQIDPTLVTIFSGFLSWIIWTVLIKASWAITLRLFGFGQRGRF